MDWIFGFLRNDPNCLIGLQGAGISFDGLNDLELHNYKPHFNGGNTLTLSTC